MTRYRPRVKPVEARRFVTNDEGSPKNMDEIVLWLNQGQSGCRAWHNGTDIWVQQVNGEYVRATVGEWIVRDHTGKSAVVSDESFGRNYEIVPL